MLISGSQTFPNRGTPITRDEIKKHTHKNDCNHDDGCFGRRQLYDPHIPGQDEFHQLMSLAS